MVNIFRNHRSLIYMGGVMLLAAGLPISPFLVSVSQGIIFLNWLTEEKPRDRIAAIWRHKSLLLFLMVFLVHLIWLLPTGDFGYAMHDIRIKLPLLILPLVLATSRPLGENEIKMILVVFITAVVVSSLFSIHMLVTASSIPVADIREISIFISHIRLSLMVCIAIFSLLYLLMTDSFRWKRPLRNFLWISLGWLIFFLFILQSLTGIMVFIVATALFIAIVPDHLRKQYWYIRTPLMYGTSFVTAVILVYGITVIISFSKPAPGEHELKIQTSLGNEYFHDTSLRQVENGNYVWININETEMEYEWNRRSSMEYRGSDLMGHELRHTLIRYLTSRGLDKDAESILKLDESDILNIERGMANYIYQYNKFLYPRIYQVIWEIHNYLQGGNPSGHSVAQRFEYWRNGFRIIKGNPLLGVGTGDVRSAWEKQYETHGTILSPQWQLRAHNQFITLMIAFGFSGFLLVLIGMVMPVLLEKRYRQILPVIFSVIVFLSFLTEDTLETQAGATFFAFFYALFIFAWKNEEQDVIEQQDFT